MTEEDPDEPSEEELEELCEKLTEELSDKEMEGFNGLLRFLETFDDAEEKLSDVFGDKPNYCPICGEEL